MWINLNIVNSDGETVRTQTLEGVSFNGEALIEEDFTPDGVLITR